MSDNQYLALLPEPARGLILEVRLITPPDKFIYNLTTTEKRNCTWGRWILLKGKWEISIEFFTFSVLK